MYEFMHASMQMYFLDEVLFSVGDTTADGVVFAGAGMKMLILSISEIRRSFSFLEMCGL